jgi:hypothetical protein
MTDKLLPCPFCGGPAELLAVRLGVTVECRWCDSRVGKVIDDKTAIEKWNRRPAAEEAVRLEREAILKAIDDIEEPRYTGYENPNTFQEGKWAAEAAIRARSEVIDDSASSEGQ